MNEFRDIIFITDKYGKRNKTNDIERLHKDSNKEVYFVTYKDGKSEYSKIEQIFMALIQEESAFANVPFTSIPDAQRKAIIKQVSSDCRRNVI